jgi:hypothetical protein
MDRQFNGLLLGGRAQGKEWDEKKSTNYWMEPAREWQESLLKGPFLTLHDNHWVEMGQ